MATDSNLNIEEYGISQYSTNLRHYSVFNLNDDSQELDNIISLSEFKKHLNYENVTGDLSEWEGAVDDDAVLLDTLATGVSELENMLYLPVDQKTYRIITKLTKDTASFILPLPNVASIYEVKRLETMIPVSSVEYNPNYTKINLSETSGSDTSLNIKFIGGFDLTENLISPSLKTAVLKLSAYHWFNRGDYDSQQYPNISQLLKPFFRYPENEYSTSFSLNSLIRLPVYCQFHLTNPL